MTSQRPSRSVLTDAPKTEIRRTGLRHFLKRQWPWVGLFLLPWVGGALFLDAHGAPGPIAGEYDAVIVAGCRVMPSGKPSVALARRTRRAVELYKAGVAPLIVFTGGVGDHAPSEAEAAATFAESLGVPRDAMVKEERSTSTAENAAFAAAERPGLTKVIVVTDAYHVWRSERVFARHFDAVTGTGVHGLMRFRIQGALREVPVIVVYGLLGRL